MPLRTPYNARRYNTPVMLTYSEAVADDFGHASIGKPTDVCKAFAYVRQMSATKTMMTFQQANVVGFEIELRNPYVKFNGMYCNGHHIQFSQPEEVERGRILRFSGYYQTDNPTML